MHISIDDIVFGNPSNRDFAIMQQPGYLDKLIPGLQKLTPPRNSSKTTQDELDAILRMVSTERVKQNNLYDEALLPHIKQLFVDAGAEVEQIDTITKNIAEDVIPLLTKLKYFFNRPRPSQLAPYFNIPIHADFSYTTNNPSYPSGHTCLTAITGEVLGNHYPEAYQIMKELIADVMTSRLYVGVHYPSDNDMSMVIAQRVVKFPEFMAKYNL